jgi:hypothetical protein
LRKACSFELPSRPGPEVQPKEHNTIAIMAARQSRPRFANRERAMFTANRPYAGLANFGAGGAIDYGGEKVPRS